MIGLLISLVTSVIDSTTRPWRKIFWFSLHLYFTAWSIFLTLVVRIITAPFRFLNAARREKLLEVQLRELQVQYEEVSEKKGDLERRLEITARDRKRIKESLDQAVAEWEKSIDRLKLLKARVQELESQNIKLRELEEEKRKLKARSRHQQQQLSQQQQQHHLQHQSQESNQRHGNGVFDDVLIMEGRGVALASSIFSAVLSLLVGFIAWEAEDPCMPLVVALFIVVGMSLSNVFQFFSKLQSRFGFDAVALLSFNWFMLGTLAFPAFPFCAKFLSLVAAPLLSWLASWFGY